MKSVLIKTLFLLSTQSYVPSFGPSPTRIDSFFSGGPEYHVVFWDISLFLTLWERVWTSWSLLRQLDVGAVLVWIWVRVRGSGVAGFVFPVSTRSGPHLPVFRATFFSWVVTLRLTSPVSPIPNLSVPWDVLQGKIQQDNWLNHLLGQSWSLHLSSTSKLEVSVLHCRSEQLRDLDLEPFPQDLEQTVQGVQEPHVPSHNLERKETFWLWCYRAISLLRRTLSGLW